MSRILGQNLRGFIAEELPSYRAAATHNLIMQIFGVDIIGADDDYDDDDDE
jgi:hypothetical protein